MEALLKDCSVNVSEDSLQIISKNGKVIESLRIQPAGEEHRNFILSTWVRSYEPIVRKLQVQSDRGQAIGFDGSDYRVGESLAAERHWSKSHVVTGLDDNYAVHAWICANTGRLWHVYVPPSFRGAGIGKGLTEQFAGRSYSVSKPMRTAFSGHKVTYSPWMNLS